MIKTVLGFSVALPVAARQGNRLKEIQKSRTPHSPKTSPKGNVGNEIKMHFRL
jgi:hypothetical protein